jgi:hypothetical protein
LGTGGGEVVSFWQPAQPSATAATKATVTTDLAAFTSAARRACSARR